MSNSRFCRVSENISNDIGEPNDHIAINNNNNDDDEKNEDNEDDFEYLQDVPYSSSSIDRSSIGSIPWADDAIKQNQLDWERVERMLSGEEPLPLEPDLRNEILEWQRKFPQLLGKTMGSDAAQNNFSEKNYDNSKPITSREHTLPGDLISNLSLNSSDDEDRYDDLDTPTAKPKIAENFVNPQSSRKSKTNISYAQKLSAKMALLRVAALPLRLSHRSDTTTNAAPTHISRERGHSGVSNLLSLHKISPNIPQNPKYSPGNSQNNDSRVYETQQRFRMPPILNVLESKKRFQNLVSNKSFVQLTHVNSPHTKSAAIIRQSDIRSTMRLQQRATPSLFTAHQHQAAWQKPLLATRVGSTFFNNRNAIILPSLNTQRVSAQQQRRNSTTTSTGANTRTNSISNSNFGTSASSSADLNLRPHYIAAHYVSRWQQINANHTSTSTATISTGRSNSAAIRHNPRADARGYGELYVPSYIGYKHDGFK